MRIAYPKRITVVVTPDDIKSGKQRNCFNCPIALVLKRIFQNHIADVTDFSVFLTDKNNLEQIQYLMSKKSRKFLLDFDARIKRYKYGIELKKYRFVLTKAS